MPGAHLSTSISLISDLCQFIDEAPRRPGLLLSSMLTLSKPSGQNYLIEPVCVLAREARIDVGGFKARRLHNLFLYGFFIQWYVQGPWPACSMR